MVLDPQAAEVVGSLMKALSAAWSAGNASAYALHFSPSVVFVPFTGDVCCGREVVERIHRDTFLGLHHSSSLENEVVESAEPLGGGAIIAQVSRDVVRRAAPGGGELSRNTYRIVLLLVQPGGEGGPWLIARWHATRVRNSEETAEGAMRHFVAEALGVVEKRVRVSVLVSLAAFASLAVGAAVGVRPRAPRTALVALAVMGMGVVAALK